jgi:hypothetical protein
MPDVPWNPPPEHLGIMPRAWKEPLSASRQISLVPSRPAMKGEPDASF